MTIDNRTLEEIAYDSLKSGAAYTKPDPEQEYQELLASVATRVVQALCEEDTVPAVTVERRSEDDDEDTWTNYTSGCVLLGVDDATGAPLDLIIDGREMSGVPITLAALTQIHTDLGYLLADDRVLAALPAGEPQPTEMPPTRMVRVKDFGMNCSFPLALSLNIGCAIEGKRKSGALNMSESQMWDTIIAASQVVEAMFDLTAGMGILGTETNKLADAAYQQGFQEAISMLKDFMELREKNPERAAALVRPKAPAPGFRQAGENLGYVMGGLTCMVDRLDQDRADRFVGLANMLSDARGAELDALVDTLLMAASPASSTVKIGRFVLDDDLDPRTGQELGTDYQCGETWIYFPDDGGRPGIRVFGEDTTYDQVDGHLSDLFALLNDPRVRAAYARYETAALVAKPA